MSSNLKLINYIISKLFDSEDNRIKLDSIQLVKQNREARKQPISGVFYQGLYFTDQPVGMRNVKNGPLHISLKDAGDRLVTDMNRVKYEKDRIRQMLSLMLEGTHSWQDVRDALPNCITSLIADTANLERTREVGYTLSPLHYQQYKKIEDRMAYYSILHLIN